jgi:FAD/FMN-containing dehydrogenase
MLREQRAMSAAGERAIAERLRSTMHGRVIDRGHPAYDEARSVWNGLIDRHPAVIAQCAGTADVVEAVNVAREYRPVVSIRGGGHQVAGSSVCDDGLVIDLSRMKGVHVDPEARTVRAQAGVTWGELDRETQLSGLATPGGEVSMTGISGLALAGGLGLLMRAYGLSCDSLRSVEIVTADGMVRTVSRHQEPDLFWAVRGGGRGLGVVTSFDFDLYRVGPDVARAQVLYRYEDAETVLRGFRDAVLTVPDSVSPEFALWSVPADPAIPAELHGSKVVVVAGVYAGPASEPAAAAALAPLRELGRPLVDLSGPVPYVEAQSALDEMFPDGGRYYMKSHFMDELSDEAVRTLLACDARRPTPESLTVIRTLGGAVADVPADDSAFAHRSTRFNLSIDATWHDPARDDEVIGWARSSWDDLLPYATGGAYLNFAGLGEESAELRFAAFGSHEHRLERIRLGHDPDGIFTTAAQRP